MPQKESAGSMPKSEILAKVFEDGPLPIFIWSRTENGSALSACNGAARRFIGEIEPIGRSPASLLSAEIADVVGDTLTSGKTFSTEVPLSRAGPTEEDLMVEIHLTAVGDSVVMRIFDRSARVAAEKALAANVARFQSLVQHAPDGVSVLDGDGNVVYFSPASERIFGQKAEDAIGASGFAMVHPDDLARARGFFSQVIDSPRRSLLLELRANTPSNGSRTLALRATNLLDDPTVGGIVLNFRDVTDERRMEAQLSQAKKMEAVGLLAGGIAHDFNNLLAVITNYAAFLEEDLAPEDEGRRGDLAEIRGAAGRGAALVRQLLAFARQEPVQPKPVDLNEVIHKALPLLKRAAGEDIQVFVSTDPDLWSTLIDPGQIDQLLLNLVVNSRDAMTKGGRLEVTTSNVRTNKHGEIRQEMRAGDYVRLCIADSGSGMTESVRERAFEPFFTTKEVGVGSGLGLASVYGTVKQAEGYVYIDHRPEGGTLVSVYLPKTERSVGEKEPAPTSPVDTGKGKTVLVVEDEEAVRKVLARMLSRGGYKVLQAGSGTEALRVANKANGIDLLITDVVMPDVSGPALARRLAELGMDLKTLFVSGYPQDIVSAKGVVDPGTALLEKPFTEDELLGRVHEMLEQH
jgi:PAS domain S-box-containing protein